MCSKWMSRASRCSIIYVHTEYSVSKPASSCDMLRIDGYYDLEWRLIALHMNCNVETQFEIVIIPSEINQTRKSLPVVLMSDFYIWINHKYYLIRKLYVLSVELHFALRFEYGVRSHDSVRNSLYWESDIFQCFALGNAIFRTNLT